ncbi:ranBP2-type zinc finger protein At1g67325-like isoform X1 [Aristolochia californica]|uniref:ranBP2-type zinc finger protein At1g67325-like isoform X1 n=2 Tax=Aristolochia californica TaxID=171875 RepID=UPI0035D92790
MSEGREGDWECSGCQNRNYAFRSFCNRCKQPRLLVDTKTPADSKWLPRIGDWICTGCSNNNYASREKCKKCGQPKEVAAMPAIAMPGASLPTYAHYFARAQGAPGLKLLTATNPNWPFGGAEKYGFHPASGWPFLGNSGGAFPYATGAGQLLMVPKGWRSGDWLCGCGFHNYSSRAQCKKCGAPMPSGGPSSAANSSASDLFPALGTKRLASDEFVNEWDNKRLNAGDVNSHFLTNGQQLPYQGFVPMAKSGNVPPDMYTTYPSGNMTAQMPSPQHATMSTLIGKGAKQWRDGDWMCTNCNNHNFASRSLCNRCKSQKKATTQPVTVT